MPQAAAFFSMRVTMSHAIHFTFQQDIFVVTHTSWRQTSDCR